MYKAAWTNSRYACIKTDTTQFLGMINKCTLLTINTYQAHSPYYLQKENFYVRTAGVDSTQCLVRVTRPFRVVEQRAHAPAVTKEKVGLPTNAPSTTPYTVFCHRFDSLKSQRSFTRYQNRYNTVFGDDKQMYFINNKYISSTFAKNHPPKLSVGRFGWKSSGL